MPLYQSTNQLHPETGPGFMSLQRAEEINSQVLAVCLHRGVGYEQFKNSELPDCTLEEMLIANRMISEENHRKSGELGSSTTTMTADPRIIAALYALKKFGGPEQLLEALGYRLAGEEDNETRKN